MPAPGDFELAAKLEKMRTGRLGEEQDDNIYLQCFGNLICIDHLLGTPWEPEVKHSIYMYTALLQLASRIAARVCWTPPHMWPKSVINWWQFQNAIKTWPKRGHNAARGPV